ncbi:Hypothetical_protein [Hexamita inflata]|uniref:Hypothetical_protein n=1 Tax=Hexamita inflata TaxID=28002 RepID=A0AA86R8L5_9EUKA|nr:Hypothetical protein HINF_LOCUS61101 [Hexamita inflata]
MPSEVLHQKKYLSLVFLQSYAFVTNRREIIKTPKQNNNVSNQQFKKQPKLLFQVVRLGCSYHLLKHNKSSYINGPTKCKYINRNLFTNHNQFKSFKPFQYSQLKLIKIFRVSNLLQCLRCRSE